MSLEIVTVSLAEARNEYSPSIIGLSVFISTFLNQFCTRHQLIYHHKVERLIILPSLEQLQICKLSLAITIYSIYMNAYLRIEGFLATSV